MRLLILLVLALLSSSRLHAFYIVSPFEERCLKSSFIVRAKILRTVELVPKPTNRNAEQEVILLPLFVQVFEVQEILKSPERFHAKYFYIPSPSFGDSDARSRFKDGAELLLFLHQTSEGFYMLHEPSAFYMITEGKVTFDFVEKGPDGKYRGASTILGKEEMIRKTKEQIAQPPPEKLKLQKQQTPSPTTSATPASSP